VKTLGSSRKRLTVKMVRKNMGEEREEQGSDGGGADRGGEVGDWGVRSNEERCKILEEGIRS